MSEENILVGRNACYTSRKSIQEILYTMSTTDVDFPTVTRVKQTVIKELEKLKTADGDYLKQIDGYIENLRKADITIRSQNVLRKNSEICSGETPKSSLEKSMKVPFLETLIQNINDRFVDSPVMESFSIFKPNYHQAKCFKVLPPHTADCERDFSQMKIIKNSLRNRLTESSLVTQKMEFEEKHQKY
ncbi:uncharacterized protein LOC130014029 [Patella vulgata]|uniref:uncharacterized protein LOC130014029 n=1 Tax=Patella vulgata TaxID=6465 RepID=UPI0024A7AB5D|nr:uncharacterized protein LOC130014029 [Patella vulgata]